MTDIQKCVREIIRQICHPEDGVSKTIRNLDREINNIQNINLSPTSLKEWFDVLTNVNGWVNFGVSESMMNVFKKLKFGEIIPDTYPNMDIYSNGFATNEIHKFLDTRNEDKSHRCVMNYESFLVFIEHVKKNKKKDYILSMNSSLKTIFKNISINNFWVNIVISEKTAEFFKNNKIGEVILKEGSGEGPRTMSEDEDILLSDCNSDESDNDDDMGDKEIYYRVLMNNTTLLLFLKQVCISEKISIHQNIFEAVGGFDDDFSDLFGKLQI